MDWMWVATDWQGWDIFNKRSLPVLWIICLQGEQYGGVLMGQNFSQYTGGSNRRFICPEKDILIGGISGEFLFLPPLL